MFKGPQGMSLAGNAPAAASATVAANPPTKKKCRGQTGQLILRLIIFIFIF